MVSNHLAVLIVVELGDDETTEQETVHQAVVRLRDLVRPQLGELVGDGEIIGVWVGIKEAAELVIQASQVELAQ